MATPASDWLRHFWLFFRKTTSFEVTRLTINIPPVFWRSVVPFVVIRNPKWLPSPLIDWNCFYFLSRKAACLVTRHPEMFFRGSNVIFPWRSSHGINYKFIYIHINYLMGIFLEFNLSYEQREITLILLRLKLEQRR